MRFGEQLAVHVNPLMLRLVIGVTFLFAGLGKVYTTIEVQGPQAATLANMGVNILPTTGGTTPPVEPPEAPDLDQAPEPDLPDGQLVRTAFQPDQPLDQPENQPAPNADPAPAQPDQPAQPAPQFSAEDFPDPTEVKTLHSVALLLDNAANPPRNVENPLPPIAPDWAAQGSRPVTLAWAVAITEITFGGLLIIGLLARLGGLALAGTMLGAIWLTQFGPAWQTDTMTGFFGFNFLPNHDPFDITSTPDSPGGWHILLWQTLLLVGSIAILFAGSGTLAIDRLLFGGKGKSHLDDDDAIDDD